MVRQILLIEKQGSLRTKLVQHLRQNGYHILETDQAAEALAALNRVPFEVVLLGLDGLKREGIAILRTIRERHHTVKVITINTGERLDLSIEAMRLGVLDDFLIPFNLEELMDRIRQAQNETAAHRPDTTPSASTQAEEKKISEV